MAGTNLSLTDRVQSIAAGEAVVEAGFMGATPVFALANGELLFVEPAGVRRVDAHADGAILIARLSNDRIVTGGDDGRVMETRAGGQPVEIARESGKWIDALAIRDDGAVAWSAGKLVSARDQKGEVRQWTAPSGVRGICFMPKGYRLAVAHYNGVSLWFPNTAAEPDALVWRGSHLDATVSPDGRFVVSAMQENSLHGWRVVDKKDMRMTGYPAKTRSFSWSHDGKWLATSGAEACIVWPFDGKDGPMGRGPRECCAREARVSRVAFHPAGLVIAIGFEDGWVMLSRLSDGAEILARAATGSKAGAISALAWNRDGKRLVFGGDDGFAGMLEIPA